MTRVTDYTLRLANAISASDAPSPKLQVSQPERPPLKRSTALAWTFGLAALGFLALQYDLPIALYFLQERCPKIVREFVELFEAFSHAFGVLMVLVTIYWMDPTSRRFLLRMGTAAICGGLAANLAKLTVSRVRPKFFDFVGGVDATFGDWWPILSAGTKGQSFPSAHAATAFGLAVALGWLFPRGRWLFVFMASMAALQRVAGWAHFISDSIWGASIGYFVASGFVCDGVLFRCFSYIETRLERHNSDETPITLSIDDARRSRAA